MRLAPCLMFNPSTSRAEKVTKKSDCFCKINTVCIYHRLESMFGTRAASALIYWIKSKHCVLKPSWITDLRGQWAGKKREWEGKKEIFAYRKETSGHIHILIKSCAQHCNHFPPHFSAADPPHGIWELIDASACKCRELRKKKGCGEWGEVHWFRAEVDCLRLGRMATSLITSLILTITSLTGMQCQCNDHVGTCKGARVKCVHDEILRFHTSHLKELSSTPTPPSVYVYEILYSIHTSFTIVLPK